MCGIIGYTGKKSAARVVTNGLVRLEYRGYDSAGIAILQDGKIDVRKKTGKLHVLTDELRRSPLDGTCAIGHVRWATHGVPNEVNAHPHLSCNKRIAVVHNGIIENHLALKKYNPFWQESKLKKRTPEGRAQIRLRNRYRSNPAPHREILQGQSPRSGTARGKPSQRLVRNLRRAYERARENSRRPI